MNPLFPDEPKDPKQHPSKDEGYLLERPKESGKINPAAELIRQKIETLYANEPDAKKEAEEIKNIPDHRSKHQQFMYELSKSGKPLAQIQQEWHNYYADLPDSEKHQVWHEFYQANNHRPSAYTHAMQEQKRRQTAAEKQAPRHEQPARHEPPKPYVIASQHVPEYPRKKPSRHRGHSNAIKQTKHLLTQKIKSQSQAQIKARQHFKSLVFGLGFGALALTILLFSFFNEVVIARLIQPTGNATATPIILNVDGIAPSDDPQIIIPKINVQLPLVYGLASNEEEVIQEGLNDGIIHYPNTSLPGQKGNGAYFGHSSNNIFNSGKYKFAFALLRRVMPGDIFYITYKGTAYTYRVYDKRVVDPDETSVLGNAPGKLATATLITCDPPGTTLKRLVVWGEQINPDPTGNAAAPVPEAIDPQTLPAQGPTLWGRFWNWVTGS